MGSAKFLQAGSLLLVLALPAGVLAADTTASSAASKETALADKKVLVLTPYGYGRPGLDSFVRGYVETLAKEGLRTENIMVEYLNLNRQVDPDYRKGARELLLHQYRGKQIDLIATLQQPALDYALNELRELAPEAPIIALNTVKPSLESLGRHPLLQPLTDLNAHDTLVQALKLFPHTDHVIVVVGASAADQKLKSQIQGIISEMGLRAVIDYTDTLSFAGMEQRVAAAPPRTIVLYGAANRDVKGDTATSGEMSIRVARAAKAPTFVMYSTTIGSGPIGGAVQHVELLAQRSAGNSVELLTGERVLAPGVTALPAPAVSMYDWEQLQHWGGDPDVLPADTIFINRPESAWDAHRELVLASAALILVLSLASIILLVQRRRLRLAETRFRIIVENAPEAIVVYDVAKRRFVDVNGKAEQLFACSREELLKAGPERFYIDAQPDGRTPAETLDANTGRALAGEEFTVERTIRALDGRIVHCQLSLVALPSLGGTMLRGCYVDISERKRVEQELVRHRDHLEDQVAERTAALSIAVRDAEAASRAKSVFLANMSHELRTPLNSIIGFSQIMGESTSMFDEEKRNLGIINRSGHHLLALINDILELSKIEAGQARLLPVPVDLGALLREVREMLGAGAQRKGLYLALDCPALPPPLLIDGGKLRQILTNLLSNAVKFTEEGSVTLSLGFERIGGEGVQLRFAVRDTGIGIAPEEQQRIFEPFVQAATQATPTGTGLGLTISRAFVLLMGGAMQLDSRPGEGSTFSFAIPAQIDPAPPPEGAAPPVPEMSTFATPMPAAARLASSDLALLDAATRSALRTALQQLDISGVATMLDRLRPLHGAVVAAIETMLAAHQYPQLCAMLDQPDVAEGA